MVSKKSDSRSGNRKSSAKRELVVTGTDKRYVRRNGQGQFEESNDVGRSLSQDQKNRARRISQPGQGDKGDRHAN